MTSHTYSTLMRRLSKAGFRREFLRPAILPDWWDESCENNPELLPDLEVRVARFLQKPVAEVRDPSFPLAAPEYERAQLRRVHDIERDRLRPAIHTALQVAGAVVRSLRDIDKKIELPPADPFAWRKQLLTSAPSLGLETLLSDLWGRGIPVIPLDLLPAPSFQGLACIVDDWPVILLGHKVEQPGRVAFFVAHEVAHIVAGDCAPGQPVVDEDEELTDDSEMEKLADLYAIRLVAGADSIPRIEEDDYKELAKNAFSLERELGVDAGVLLYTWARQSRNYVKAANAVRALYRSTGARNTLRDYVDRQVDFDAAVETDRNLLRCIHGNTVEATITD